MVRHEPRELRARQLLAEHDRPVRRRPVQLEHVLLWMPLGLQGLSELLSM
jgi:hypothetical protein